MKRLELLDPLIHAPIRLGVMTILVSVREADFVFLRESIGTTDGNLSTHLLKLEEAKYIQTTKKFEERKPKTRFTLTPVGRKALESYIATIEKYVKLSKPAK